MKTHITIQQLLSDANEEQREQLKAWWKPRIGDLYYDSRFDFACVVGLIDELGNIRGQFVPLMSVGQMIWFTGKSLRPKIFKVTKNQIRYYKEKHNPPIKLTVNWWAISCRQTHTQHLVFCQQHLVDALWQATLNVLKN